MDDATKKAALNALSWNLTAQKGEYCDRPDLLDELKAVRLPFMERGQYAPNKPIYFFQAENGDQVVLTGTRAQTLKNQLYWSEQSHKTRHGDEVTFNPSSGHFELPAQKQLTSEKTRLQREAQEWAFANSKPVDIEINEDPISIRWVSFPEQAQ